MGSDRTNKRLTGWFETLLGSAPAGVRLGTMAERLTRPPSAEEVAVEEGRYWGDVPFRFNWRQGGLALNGSLGLIAFSAGLRWGVLR